MRLAHSKWAGGAFRKTALFLWLSLLAAGSAAVLDTVEDALARRFPGAEIRKVSHFLTPAQRERIQQLAECPTEGELLHAYEVREGDRVAARAYLDTHRVRTLPETVMVVVDEKGLVDGIDVLMFKEPLEYMPSERWYAQFLGRRLDSGLKLKRDIQGTTGATLTARATVEAVRRALSADQVLSERESP